MYIYAYAYIYIYFTLGYVVSLVWRLPRYYIYIYI